MHHRWPLPVPALVVLAALGSLSVGLAPPAHACSVVAPPVVWIPMDQATDEDRRWALRSSSDPDFLEVVQPRPLPPGGVLFEGTAVAAGARPSRNADWGRAGAPTWTFRVEQVHTGDLAPEVVVVGVEPGAPCGHLGPRYQVGARQQVAAVRDPATGELRGLTGRYADLPPKPTPVRPTPVPVPTAAAPPVRPTPVATTAPAPTPDPHRGAAEVDRPPRPARQQGAVVPWIVAIFLAEVGVLGVVLTGAAVYLRARELDLEERELALREREAAARERRAGR